MHGTLPLALNETSRSSQAPLYITLNNQGTGRATDRYTPRQQEGALAKHCLECRMVVHGHTSAEQVVGVVLLGAIRMGCTGHKATQWQLSAKQRGT